MALSRQQIFAVTALLFYWPTIFILTHIPMPHWASEIHMSDKTLHCLAYFVLVFLLWFTINPDRRVNWTKAAVWWVLLVVAWYGAFDEWLQGYVGRNPSAADFFADLGGTLIGLVLLSICPFWVASLVVTGAVIFVLTNFLQADLIVCQPLINAALHVFAYGFFSFLWIRCMSVFLPIRRPEPKWLIGALALPAGFLLAVELFSVIVSGVCSPLRAAFSFAGIIAAVIPVYLVSLFRKRFTQELGRDEF